MFLSSENEVCYIIEELFGVGFKSVMKRKRQMFYLRIPEGIYSLLGRRRFSYTSI